MMTARAVDLFRRHPFRRFSQREIVSYLEAPPAICLKVVDDLILLGVLKRQEESGVVFYRVNYSGPCWDALDELFKGHECDQMMVSFHPSACVFLDRDGVINKVVMRKGNPFSPRNINEFEWTDGVKESIERLKEHNFLVVIVTNQPDIARGKMSRESLDAMTEMIYSSMLVDAIWICPHDDVDACSCRKPKPGMLLEAAKRWGIDRSRSFMIGDSWKDMEAGQAAGCTTILLDRAYNQGVTCNHRLPSLKEAVGLILKLNKENT